MKFEVGPEVSPLVRVKRPKHIQPIIFDTINRTEALMTESIGSELVEAPGAAIVIQPRIRLKERSPGISIALLKSINRSFDDWNRE